MDIKFSILIPTYKGRFLKEAIHSILNQTYNNFEIIIVNDASPDNIEAVVQEFTDSRILYYVNKNNCGAINVVDNWNICLNYAKGDYVICMGDDDKLKPICLEEYYRLIKKYPKLDIYHTWTEIIDENSNVISIQEARPEREGVYSMMWHRWKGRTQYIGDFLFCKETLIRNGGFYKLPLAWGSDDISAYIAAQSYGIANTQIPGFQYRINRETITNTGNIETKLKAIDDDEKWSTSFLNRKILYINKEEEIFHKMLLEYIKIRYIKKRLYTIASDVAKNYAKIFKYYINKHHYHMNTKMLIYTLIESIKLNNK